MQIFLPSREDFHFDLSIPAGLQMEAVIVALTLNFAIVIGMGVIAWRFFHA
jgi:hypothetical protein